MVLVFDFSRHVDRRQDRGDEAHACGRELDACGEVGKEGDKEARGGGRGPYEADKERVVVHSL